MNSILSFPLLVTMYKFGMQRSFGRYSSLADTGHDFFIWCKELSRLHLWSNGYRSGFDSRCHQIFSEVVGLERGQLSLVSTIEELLGRKSRGSGLEIREYVRRNTSRWPRATLCPQMLALTSPTRGSRSVGIVRSRIEVTIFFCKEWSKSQLTSEILKAKASKCSFMLNWVLLHEDVGDSAYIRSISSQH
jgi:hypothetical protein